MQRIIVALSFILALFIAQNVNAENSFSFGIMPMEVKLTDAQKAFEDVKENQLTSEGAGGYLRIKNDKGESFSEGCGYGLLLAVIQNDKEVFDQLLRYILLYLNKHGLMSWIISEEGLVLDPNSATDADQDIAFALLLADSFWGSNGSLDYLQIAKSMLDNMMDYEVEPITYILKPGDVWGGSDVTNPSYFSMAYYRIFQEISGDVRWQYTLDKSYEILEKAANSKTGLLPDWCDANGNPVPNFSYDFTYDASRAPWRIGLDYLWFGDSRAQVLTKKITESIQFVGIENTVDGYRLDGTLIGKWHNSPFIGPFSVATMATSIEFQDVCDEAYQENVSVSGDNYFNRLIRALTLSTAVGIFNPGELVPACSSSTLFFCEEDECSSINLYWYGETCNASPTCSPDYLTGFCQTENDCLAAEGDWIKGICQPANIIEDECSLPIFSESDMFLRLPFVNYSNAKGILFNFWADLELILPGGAGFQIIDFGIY